MKIVLLLGSEIGYKVLKFILHRYGKYDISYIVWYKEITIGILANKYNIPHEHTIYSKEAFKAMKEADLVLSVHGREILPKEFLDLPKKGCYNIHPFWIEHQQIVRIALHKMIEEVDAGEIVLDRWVALVDTWYLGKKYNYPFIYKYYIELIKEVFENGEEVLL